MWCGVSSFNVSIIIKFGTQDKRKTTADKSKTRKAHRPKEKTRNYEQRRCAAEWSVTISSVWLLCVYVQKIVYLKKNWWCLMFVFIRGFVILFVSLSFFVFFSGIELLLAVTDFRNEKRYTKTYRNAGGKL